MTSPPGHHDTWKNRMRLSRCIGTSHNFKVKITKSISGGDTGLNGQVHRRRMISGQTCVPWAMHAKDLSAVGNRRRVGIIPLLPRQNSQNPLPYIIIMIGSVQFKMVSVRTGRPICAPPRLSGVSPMLPLKPFPRFFVRLGDLDGRLEPGA